jgi:hypothetical protein
MAQQTNQFTQSPLFNFYYVDEINRSQLLDSCLDALDNFKSDGFYGCNIPVRKRFQGRLGKLLIRYMSNCIETCFNLKNYKPNVKVNPYNLISRFKYNEKNKDYENYSEETRRTLECISDVIKQELNYELKYTRVSAGNGSSVNIYWDSPYQRYICENSKFVCRSLSPFNNGYFSVFRRFNGNISDVRDFQELLPHKPEVAQLEQIHKDLGGGYSWLDYLIFKLEVRLKYIFPMILGFFQGFKETTYLDKHEKIIISYNIEAIEKLIQYQTTILKLFVIDKDRREHHFKNLMETKELTKVITLKDGKIEEKYEMKPIYDIWYDKYDYLFPCEDEVNWKQRYTFLNEMD